MHVESFSDEAVWHSQENFPSTKPAQVRQQVCETRTSQFMSDAWVRTCHEHMVQFGINKINVHLLR
jgi:hypothetical protein